MRSDDDDRDVDRPRGSRTVTLPKIDSPTAVRVRLASRSTSTGCRQRGRPPRRRGAGAEVVPADPRHRPVDTRGSVPAGGLGGGVAQARRGGGDDLDGRADLDGEGLCDADGDAGTGGPDPRRGDPAVRGRVLLHLNGVVPAQVIGELDRLAEAQLATRAGMHGGRRRSWPKRPPMSLPGDRVEGPDVRDQGPLAPTARLVTIKVFADLGVEMITDHAGWTGYHVNLRGTARIPRRPRPPSWSSPSMGRSSPSVRSRPPTPWRRRAVFRCASSRCVRVPPTSLRPSPTWPGSLAGRHGSAT